MKRSIFESFTNAHNISIMRSNACVSTSKVDGSKRKKVVMLTWFSPYAKEKHNQRLQKDLQRAYEKYHISVLLESMGMFWE